jgi:hypothetical protein
MQLYIISESISALTENFLGNQLRTDELKTNFSDVYSVIILIIFTTDDEGSATRLRIYYCNIKEASNFTEILN